MEKCKYCECENLFLEAKNPGEDLLTANQVSLKCARCNKWLKWVKKEDRLKYLVTTNEAVPLINKVPIDTAKEPIKADVVKMLKNLTDCDFTDNSIDAPQPTKEEFAISVLNELRREMLMEQTYFRSNVIGAIDSKIKKLRK